MRYRVETVHVPGPSQADQDATLLQGKRIVHVYKMTAVGAMKGGFDVMALTEEADPPGGPGLA